MFASACFSWPISPLTIVGFIILFLSHQPNVSLSACINRQLQHCTCKDLRANFAEKRRNFGASAVLVSARFRELG